MLSTSNKVRIVHFSDFHAQFRPLPEADLYICSGDMLGTYPKMRPMTRRDRELFEMSFGSFGFKPVMRQIVPAHERNMQTAWFNNKFAWKGTTLRKFFGSPDAPVAVVRGNHDFVEDLGLMFGGDFFEFKLLGDVWEVCGLRVGGFRGIPYIVGEWADEFQDDELERRCDRIPHDLDVLVTHCPPLGILDKCYKQALGARPLSNWINKILYEGEDFGRKMPKLFCFGHIHENGGKILHGKSSPVEGTIFSNAATDINVIELEI